MILVDTSTLVNYLRGMESEATRALDKLMEGGFCITPFVFQEVLQGARDEREYKTLKDYLGSQLFCYPTDPLESHERAAKIYFDCRRKGLTVRSTTDCFIAQIAIDNSLPLLHDDRDFEKIAKVSALALAL